MLAIIMALALVWALDDRRAPVLFSSDVLAEVTCIIDAKLREGIVIREIDDGGDRFAWRIDQDGQEQVWWLLPGENRYWCTMGEPVFLHGRGHPTA